MFNDDHAISTARPPRRRRFWLLVVGVPLLLGVLAGVGWLATVSGGLQSAIAEADAQDPRWRFEDLDADRYTPPPGQNAADRVLAVTQRLPRSNWWDPKKDE